MSKQKPSLAALLASVAPPVAAQQSSRRVLPLDPSKRRTVVPPRIVGGDNVHALVVPPAQTREQARRQAAAAPPAPSPPPAPPVSSGPARKQTAFRHRWEDPAIGPWLRTVQERLSTERWIDRAVTAAALRAWLAHLGAKGVSVTTPRHAWANAVDIRPKDGRTFALPTVEILERAFSGAIGASGGSLHPYSENDRSDFQTDYHALGGVRIATADVPVLQHFLAVAMEKKGVALSQSGRKATKATPRSARVARVAVPVEAQRAGQVVAPVAGASVLGGMLAWLPSEGLVWIWNQAEIPPAHTRAALTSAGFRWHRAKRLWYFPRTIGGKPSELPAAVANKVLDVLGVDPRRIG